MFDALRWSVRTGSPWRYIPNDLPPHLTVYQQTQRWIAAGGFDAMVHDLRVVLRLKEKRAPGPSAVILDSRTPRSTPESGGRAGHDDRRKNGSQIHGAAGTLGHLLVLHDTPADEQDRTQVAALAEAVQEATGESVELAYVDQDYTGEALEIYGGHIGHEGHISRTVLAMLEQEGVVAQNAASKRWAFRPQGNEDGAES